MTLTELLEKIRALYVKELQAAVRAAKAKKLGPMHIEPLLRGDNGEVVREGALGTGIRLDLVVSQKDGLEDVRVDSASRLEFESLTIPWSDTLSVDLEPFVWDALVIEADVAKKRVLEVARPWLDEWMDTEDERDPGKDGVLRVVHFAADPIAMGKRTMFSVDLGSAPPDALLSLVDALGRVGATQLRLSSDPGMGPGTKKTKGKEGPAPGVTKRGGASTKRKAKKSAAPVKAKKSAAPAKAKAKAKAKKSAAPAKAKAKKSAARAKPKAKAKKNPAKSKSKPKAKAKKSAAPGSTRRR